LFALFRFLRENEKENKELKKSQKIIKCGKAVTGTSKGSKIINKNKLILNNK
jgi:hypothetical protein